MKLCVFFSGCHRLADFEGNVKKDYEKAAKVYKTNCDDYKYGHSCFKYGNLVIMGKGTCIWKAMQSLNKSVNM